MKKVKWGLSLLLVVAAGGARAGRDDGGDPFPRLFSDPKLPAAPVEERAQEAVARVAADCTFSELSRIGPSPKVLDRCNRAEENALRFGVEGARGALAVLDRPATSVSARYRLYDVVARGGDMTTAETLVAGLERARRLDSGLRAHEAYQIGEALRRITSASVGERAPWDGESGEHPGAWRAFVAAHRGESRGQLLADRSVEARVHKGARELTTAFVAARFLAAQPATRTEGVAALRALLGRPRLDRNEEETIRSTLDQLPPPMPGAVAAQGKPQA
jgi:hypothetical protein